VNPLANKCPPRLFHATPVWEFPQCSDWTWFNMGWTLWISADRRSGSAGTSVPELQHLEAQFAALLPYGVSAHMLSTVLPLERATSITTWKRHVAALGARLDREAHERIVAAPVLNAFGLPRRNPLQAIGNDGGYVKAADAPSRLEGWFEVMVGKSLPRAGSGQVFAFVHRPEACPTERVERFLAQQGVFPAQPTTLSIRWR
jgi:hypothetical protein